MLVLSRKPGEWISIGDIYFIQVDEYKRDGKYTGMLKIYIEEERFNSEVISTTRYLGAEPVYIGDDIELVFIGTKGVQYKIGIDAPLDFRISRLNEHGDYELDSENEHNDNDKELDGLQERYKDELSWFYN